MSGRGFRWTAGLLAAVSIAALGLAGCGGGGGGGGGGVSPFTRVGGNDHSGDLGVALSGDGRYVAFASRASNLVATDTNSAYDIFVFDRQTGTIDQAPGLGRVSVSSGVTPAEGDANSLFPAISSDGRFVAFESDATNLGGLGPIDAAFTDIYIRDRGLGFTTERVSVAIGAPAVQPNGNSHRPSISGNGQFVAFVSSATNLHAADADSTADVFLRDRTAGSTTLVSRATGAAGAKGNGASTVFGHAVSDDGSVVAFESAATNLSADDADAGLDVYVRNLEDNTTTLVSRATGAAGAKGTGESRISGISGNGQFVVFESDATNLVAGDNNSVRDVFVRNLVTNETTRVSVATGGAQATGGGSFALGHRAISDDGNRIVFESDATNLGATGAPAFYARDRAADTTTPLAVTSTFALSGGVTISGNGLVAAFATDDGGLVGGDTGDFFDVFIMAVP